MKRLVRITSLMTLLLFLVANMHSFAKKKPEATNGNSNQGITYVVTVSTPPTGETCNAYFIVIRDESGEQLSAGLHYQPGITNYIFHESGPVSGTRTAYLERTGASQYLCNEILVAEPDAISGEFKNGYAYLFSLNLFLQYGNN